MATPFNAFVATQAFAIAAFNATVNASYTWWLWSPLDRLSLHGPGNIATDLATTPIVIAVLSALLGTAFIRQKLRDGRVAIPKSALPTAFHLAPHGLVQRTVVFGFLAAIALGLPLWLGLQATGLETLTLTGAVLAKVAITIVLTLLIVPLTILAALADVQRTPLEAAA